MEMMVAGSANAATTCSVARPPVPSPPPPQMVERRARPQKEQPLPCPRCNSTNTKFCYYNNYSLTQPRYFCKTCRRYWTEGGSLRNVPVGGGSRKNKRSASSASNGTSSSSATTSSSTITSTTSATSVSTLQMPVFKKLPVDHMGAHHLLVPSAHGNPKFLEGTHDLNLAFVHPHLAAGSDFGHDYHSFSSLGGSLTAATSSGAAVTTTSCGLSAMELLRGAGISARGMNPFMAMPNPETTGSVYTPGSFDLQGFRPNNNATTLSFPMDSVGLGDGYSGSLHGVQQQEEAMPAAAASGRMLFPFEDLRHISSAAASDQMGQQNRDVQTGGAAAGGEPSPGFWNSMIGGGANWQSQYSDWK